MTFTILFDADLDVPHALAASLEAGQMFSVQLDVKEGLTSEFEMQKRIQALDTEIDAHVYRLYGLTEE